MRFNKNQGRAFFRGSTQWLWVAMMLCAHRPDAPAQLAITEVMSFGSSREDGFQRPDFWELTNLGTNSIDLTGYRWFDSSDTPFESRILMPATTLGPTQSIIILRKNTIVPDLTAFRAWWGTNLPDNLQVYVALNSSGNAGPGFDELGDAVRLWDPQTNLVDEVRFEGAHLGVTFTYNTNSGIFSEFSEEGLAGVFRSAQGQDIGSPGYAPLGRVALRITQQPISQAVDAGSEVILKAQATGRPGPQFRWYSNGVPIQIAVATSGPPRLVCFADCGPSWRSSPGPNDFVFPTIQPGQSGNYFVKIFNGFETLTSVVATVTVSTNTIPLQTECPPKESCVPCSGTASPAELVAGPGQTAIFTIRNRGFPLPTFQWSRSSDGVNFTNLPGKTNRDLMIQSIQPSDAGLYRVRMANILGTTSAVARLTVKASPRLKITEVMAQACSAHDRDWWELTNTNAEPVNLCGYRWDDNPPAIGGGPTIANNVIVPPGGSVVLLENQTAESFIQWWGASNLPPNLQFITYAANGLTADGDSIRLWSPNETDSAQFVASVGFSLAARGNTYWFDYEFCADSEFGAISSNGDCGAFPASQGCEIGSPGWTRSTPPTLTDVRRIGSTATLSWRAQPGSNNKVQFARQLGAVPGATVWEDLNTFQFPWAACSTIDVTLGADAQRFYRVVRVAAANCFCPPEVE